MKNVLFSLSVCLLAALSNIAGAEAKTKYLVDHNACEIIYFDSTKIRIQLRCGTYRNLPIDMKVLSVEKQVLKDRKLSPEALCNLISDSAKAKSVECPRSNDLLVWWDNEGGK